MPSQRNEQTWKSDNIENQPECWKVQKQAARSSDFVIYIFTKPKYSFCLFALSIHLLYNQPYH